MKRKPSLRNSQTNSHARPHLAPAAGSIGAAHAVEGIFTQEAGGAEAISRIPTADNW